MGDRRLHDPSGYALLLLRSEMQQKRSSTLYVSNASIPSSIDTLPWQRGGDNIYDVVATTICNMSGQER